MAGLNNRARKILFAAVAEYIATGEPVGSRTLARKYAIDLSSASIRNVLSDLEHGGYLRQPHTSAGRVPTELALRAFIHALTEFQQIPHEDMLRMRARFDEIFAQAEGAGPEALRRTGKILSELSGAAAVVTSSTGDSRKLSRLRFIVTRPDQLLAVAVFADGMVENRFIRVEEGITESDLLRVHNLLADVVEGRTIEALRDLFRRRLDDDRGEIDRLRRQAFDLGMGAVGSSEDSVTEVAIEGRARLMDMPEYADLDRLRRLLEALEDREHLVDLLDRTIDAGHMSVFIGSETGEFGDGELALVAAPYGDGGKGLGTVGVLGPTRMDYARLMPLVDATAAAITDVLKKTQ